MFDKDLKKLYGFIVASRLRSAILQVLYKNANLRQMQIATKLKSNQQNINKAVYELEKAKLIECLTPDKARWKPYMITELGKEVLEFAKKQKEEAKKRK